MIIPHLFQPSYRRLWTCSGKPGCRGTLEWNGQINSVESTRTGKAIQKLWALEHFRQFQSLGLLKFRYLASEIVSQSSRSRCGMRITGRYDKSAADQGFSFKAFIYEKNQNGARMRLTLLLLKTEDHQTSTKFNHAIRLPASLIYHWLKSCNPDCFRWRRLQQTRLYYNNSNSLRWPRWALYQCTS